MHPQCFHVPQSVFVRIGLWRDLQISRTFFVLVLARFEHFVRPSVCPSVNKARLGMPADRMLCLERKTERKHCRQLKQRCMTMAPRRAQRVQRSAFEEKDNPGTQFGNVVGWMAAAHAELFLPKSWWWTTPLCSACPPTMAPRRKCALGAPTLITPLWNVCHCNRSQQASRDHSEKTCLHGRLQQVDGFECRIST
jgi:hypothetical protein